MTERSTRILVPLDRSEEAERAIAPALDLAGALGGDVVLFCWSDDMNQAWMIRTYLEEQVAGLDTDVPVSIAIDKHDERSAPEAIAAAAAHHDATICMATHGRSGIGKAIMGSVAEEVLHLVDAPVFLCGPNLAAGAATGDRSVLVCVDGSERSETVVEPALTWAHALGRPAHLVQVIDPTVRDLDLAAEDVVESAYLERLSEDTGADEWEVLHGDSAVAVVTQAAERAALIALGTRARGGLARTVLGSVAIKIVHKAHCPVLAVHTGNGG